MSPGSTHTRARRGSGRPPAGGGRVGPARRREGLGPVRVDARDDLVEEALDLRRLRAPAARRRAGLWRRLGHRLLDPRQDLLDALLQPLARLLGALAQVADRVLRAAPAERDA